MNASKSIKLECERSRPFDGKHESYNQGVIIAGLLVVKKKKTERKEKNKKSAKIVVSKSVLHR